MKKREHTNRVIFHHSLARKSSVEDIRNWHRARGFDDIGYHFVIRKSGVSETGRDIHLVGAHAEGRNFDSIGVCFEGDFRTEGPTDAQLDAVVGLYHGLCRAYSKNLEIEYHREDENPCPGQLLDRELLTRRCVDDGSI